MTSDKEAWELYCDVDSDYRDSTFTWEEILDAIAEVKQCIAAPTLDAAIDYLTELGYGDPVRCACHFRGELQDEDVLGGVARLTRENEQLIVEQENLQDQLEAVEDYLNEALDVLEACPPLNYHAGDVEAARWFEARREFLKKFDISVDNISCRGKSADNEAVGATSKTAGKSLSLPDAIRARSVLEKVRK